MRSWAERGFAAILSLVVNSATAWAEAPPPLPPGSGVPSDQSEPKPQPSEPAIERGEGESWVVRGGVGSFDDGEVPFPRKRLGIAGEAGAVGTPGFVNVSFVGLRGIAGVQVNRWVALHGLLAIGTSGFTTDVRGGALFEYTVTNRVSISFGVEGEGLMTVCQTSAFKPSTLCAMPAVAAPLVVSFHSVPRPEDRRRKVFSGGIELRPSFIAIGPPFPVLMGGSIYFGYDEM